MVSQTYEGLSKLIFLSGVTLMNSFWTSHLAPHMSFDLRDMRLSVTVQGLAAVKQSQVSRFSAMQCIDNSTRSSNSAFMFAAMCKQRKGAHPDQNCHSTLLARGGRQSNP